MQDRPSRTLPYGTSEFYASLVDRCVQGALEALGERNVEAVLLVGAPARGEATVVSVPGGQYSLSDVDLVCLSRPGADLTELRGRLATWVAAANAELSSACSGVDASVKTSGVDGQVYPLIATFEMLRSPTVVWGDEAVLGRLPDIDIADVPAWDSLVLFHNRTVEQMLVSRRLGTPDGTPALVDGLSLLYASGKYLLDAVTALLFLEGDVPETYLARARTFSGELLSRPEHAGLRTSLEEFLPDIEAWARFKSAGDLSELDALPGPPLGDARALARACLRRYASCSGTLWRAILGGVVGVDAGGLAVEEVVALYSKLESLPRKVGRAVRTLRSPAGRAGLFSARRVLGRATFASPRELAYATAVLSYLSLADGFDARKLGSLLDRCCPFSVPPDFGRSPLEAKRDVLVDRLSLFHASVLRGREIPERS
ncbi:MAG: hypothetical protein ABIG03_06765 [Candidatus Eisenbacteria bacterium]